ncbi:MAG: hypothetical protein COC19_06070 [SAR86 cluster bacterium]|uniref:histidine kinase n=1 Tax=SAR86 cluster bacterium TaxID=2030880 RepID=A0A2A4MJX7_9GAMM|nr:MAG: hypothetical protein COC19_06070 [SAR86 cluster bacterium]
MPTQSDLKNTLKLLAIIWLALLVIFSLRELAGTLTMQGWQYDMRADLWLATVQMWMPWVFMSPLLVMAVKRFSFTLERWGTTLLWHLLFLTGFTVVHLAAVAYHYHYLSGLITEQMQLYAGWQHMGHFLVSDPFVLMDVMVYLLFASSFNMSRYIALVREKDQQARELEQSLATSRLHALQMQVNPHFLFNTLNSVSVLVHKHDWENAQEMIHQLSDFFRATLQEPQSQLVSLKTELELVDNYLAIEQIRFKDRLSIVKNLDQRAMSIPVPVMLLQPLVENSLRHGIASIQEKGIITISSRLTQKSLIIEISDNGCGIAGSVSGRPGIGLSNVQSRLQQIYGEEYRFEMVINPGEGATVTLELPLSADTLSNNAISDSQRQTLRSEQANLHHGKA